MFHTAGTIRINKSHMIEETENAFIISMPNRKKSVYKDYTFAHNKELVEINGDELILHITHDMDFIGKRYNDTLQRIETTDIDLSTILREFKATFEESENIDIPVYVIYAITEEIALRYRRNINATQEMFRLITDKNNNHSLHFPLHGDSYPWRVFANKDEALDFFEQCCPVHVDMDFAELHEYFLAIENSNEDIESDTNFIDAPFAINHPENKIFISELTKYLELDNEADALRFIPYEIKR